MEPESLPKPPADDVSWYEWFVALFDWDSDVGSDSDSDDDENVDWSRCFGNGL